MKRRYKKRPIDRGDFVGMLPEQVGRFAEKFLTKTEMIAWLDTQARAKGYGDLYSPVQLNRESRNYVIEIFVDEIADPLPKR